MRYGYLTPLVRRDPFDAVDEEVFDELWARPGWLPGVRFGETPAQARARMDVVERGDTYVITAELPGAKKEDIDVSVDGAHVAISARHTLEEMKEGERLLLGERYTEDYARSLELPTEVTDADADAVFEDGVLTLSLHKREPAATRRIAIH
jgi:HSP20 family protein